MLQRIHLRLHDVIAAWPRAVIAAMLLAALTSVPVVLATARLDLSFRPLFADDPGAAAATAAFEARFGQPSGAWIGAIVERATPLDGELVARLARASLAAAALPHVVEVLSPASLTVAVWDGEGARAVALAEPAELARGGAEAAEAARREASGPFRPVLSADGRQALLLARLDLPLDDLRGRRAVIDEFRVAMTSELRGERIHFTGVSVVEAEYARAVLRSLARSLLLTTGAILLVLLLLFRHPGAALVPLAGVTVAVPMTLALLGAAGRPITMLGSMVPTVILIIGVADAIHMQRRWIAELRRPGADRAAAVRRMYGAMALPCLLTSMTTAAGFLSLGVARVAAIRGFGVAVAVGVGVVYAANLLLVPALLHLLGPRLPFPADARRRGRAAGLASRAVLRHPRMIVAAAAAAALGVGAGARGIVVDQRFNEELGAAHPVRVGQELLEREFGGFLGPEIEIERNDGGSVLEPDALARVLALRDELAALPSVDLVSSLFDIAPAAPGDLPPDVLREGLARLAEDPALGRRTRELVGDEDARLALHVRTGDLGTRHALALADTIAAVAASRLGQGYEARVVGQWWLAQLGTASLVRDVVASLLVSALVVLPVLGLALRSRRFFLLAIGPNLLPIIAALGFMGWAGITLRIGTALVLAIALAIAVDDTIHVLVRLREAELHGAGVARAVREALGETGGALLATTAVLVAGFLSMLSNDLAAIRHMGLVAAVALGAALLADLFLAPSIYALSHPRAEARLRSPVPSTRSTGPSKPTTAPPSLDAA